MQIRGHRTEPFRMQCKNLTFIFVIYQKDNKYEF